VKVSAGGGNASATVADDSGDGWSVTAGGPDGSSAAFSGGAPASGSVITVDATSGDTNSGDGVGLPSAGIGLP
jgi:hypothetical protein